VKKFRRPALLALLAFALFAVYTILSINGFRQRTFDDVSKIPYRKVGLVLGCAPTVRGGYPNLFFEYRMEAAAKLYKAGKVDYLLVSGDNRHRSYDEPTAMKAALIKAGVPKTRIVCDYAGFTTLDSVVRANKVFQEQAFTVISQPFHNERALYIADGYGIDAIGYNAEDVPAGIGMSTYLREVGSRVKAVWDVKIRHRQPHFLGEPLPIGTMSRS
jgi:SanA protein